jgi:hypothetical protein
MIFDTLSQEQDEGAVVDWSNYVEEVFVVDLGCWTAVFISVGDGI